MELTNYKGGNKKRKSGSLELGAMMYGKVPPQARDLEEAVLGACMIEKSAFDIVLEILPEQCFYVEAHQRVCKAMKDLYRKNMPIDLLTVVEELKFKEELDIVGGPYFITRLTNSVVSAANIETHCRIILQKFIQRELIRISGEIIGDAYEDSTDVFDLLDSSEEKLFQITNNYLKKNYTPIDSILVKVFQRIDDLRNSSEHISGVPSGFFDLDRTTYGWQATDLIILAARPSVGKTALALNFALNAAIDNFKPTGVGFFSLEMSAGQLVQRLLSAQSEIYLEKIARGKLEEHEMKILYTKGVAKLAGLSLHIDDTAALNMFELRAKARRMVQRDHVGLIIIDYIQLMSSENDKRSSNREQEVSKISRDLKALAKELKIPVIALSQLSREVEKRKEGNKMPQLSDLRESGAIEQDADVVMFMYRPEYYDINQDEMGESNRGETHIKIAKHRNGICETIKLTAKLDIQKFVNYEKPHEIHPSTGSGKAWTPAITNRPNTYRDPFPDDNDLNENTPF